MLIIHGLRLEKWVLSKFHRETALRQYLFTWSFWDIIFTRGGFEANFWILETRIRNFGGFETLETFLTFEIFTPIFYLVPW